VDKVGGITQDLGMSLWVTVVVVVLVVAWVVLPRLGWVKPTEAAQALRAGAILVDVRTPGEFRGHAVAGAVNLPLGELGVRVAKEGWPKEQVLLVYCASGTRSALAARQLKAQGYTQVRNLGTVARAEAAAGGPTAG